MKKYIVMADGASRGNPGKSSLGVVCFFLEDESNVPSLEEFKKNNESTVFKISKRLEDGTNNEAEYQALIEGLFECQKRDIKSPIVFLDSELLVRQMSGIYKIKSPKLKNYYEKAFNLMNELKAKILHVKREKNKIADYLANMALDK
ncbi:MAG: ribonuclease HI family protein [Spirochaetia bacterium]|nr:ribonuclease HI family protein [Spirochaetia bacterium]